MSDLLCFQVYQTRNPGLLCMRHGPLVTCAGAASTCEECAFLVFKTCLSLCHDMNFSPTSFMWTSSPRLCTVLTSGWSTNPMQPCLWTHSTSDSYHLLTSDPHIPLTAADTIQDCNCIFFFSFCRNKKHVSSCKYALCSNNFTFVAAKTLRACSSVAAKSNSSQCNCFLLVQQRKQSYRCECTFGAAKMCL